MPHVFISYVREDSLAVERLGNALGAYDIAVWLDKEQIRPGVRWADAIREAIGGGAFFIACFSKAYSERTRTYMNEELTLAIEELRQRSTHQTWFIPVLLDECEIPNRSVGGGETLRSLQWVRLYEDWNDGIARILSTIQPASAELHKLKTSLEAPSARVRIQAADRLGKLGSLARKAADSLLRLLHDENYTVRAAAADAIGRIGVQGTGVADGLLRVMRDGEFYSSRHAADSLARLGVEGVPALLEATTFGGFGIAHFASEALATIKDPAATPLLINALNSAIGDTRDCQVQRDGSHSGPHLAQSICTALGRIGDPAALGILTKAQNCHCKWTQASASKAVATIRTATPG